MHTRCVATRDHLILSSKATAAVAHSALRSGVTSAMDTFWHKSLLRPIPSYHISIHVRCGLLLLLARNHFTPQFDWRHGGRYFGFTPGSRGERHTQDIEHANSP